MATDVRIPSPTSITVLLRGIVNDVQDLVRQQLALFRQEVRDEVRTTRDGLLIIVAGAGLALVGVLVIALGLPLLLNWLAPQIPLWACFGIVGAAGALMGAAVIYAGVRQLKSIDAIPPQTVDALRENLTWTTHPR